MATLRWSYRIALLAIILMGFAWIATWSTSDEQISRAQDAATPIATLPPGPSCSGSGYSPTLEIVLQIRTVDGSPVSPEELVRAQRIVERRAADLSPDGCGVWSGSDDQLFVQLVADDPEVAITTLTRSARLEIFGPIGSVPEPGTVVQSSLTAPGVMAASPPQSPPDAFPPLISGADVTDAYVISVEGGEYSVGFALTEDAGARFLDFSESHIGATIAITVEERVIAVTVVQGPVSNQAVIAGGFTLDEAHLIAYAMQAGALVGTLEVVDVHTVIAEPVQIPSLAAATPASTSSCWASSAIAPELAGYLQWAEPPRMTIDMAKRYSATVDTSEGSFVIQLFANDAPQTVNNFVCLARAGFYDGIVFHRVVQGFVIQAGDPTGLGNAGPGYAFADELPTSLNYDTGVLAMANAGPNTNGSQFFICLADLSQNLPKNYSIFGMVISGMDVVDAIGNVPVQTGPTSERSSPVEPVTIVRIAIAEN